MAQASSLNHDELYEALRDNKLDPESFDHESHIRLAWYYLTRWPYDEACERFNRHFLRFIVRANHYELHRLCRPLKLDEQGYLFHRRDGPHP